VAVGTGTFAEGWSIKSDDDRIALIRQQVLQCLQPTDAPTLLFTARATIAGCPAGDDKCELRSLYRAVQRGPLPVPIWRTGNPNGGPDEVVALPGIPFIQDARWTDVYPTAKKVLEWALAGAPGEDCDGHVIVMCSFLLLLGWLPGVVIASRDGSEFVHIFPVAAYPKLPAEGQVPEWIPLDTTVPGAGVGWWPPRGFVRRMRVYGITMDGPVVGRDIA